MEQSHGSRFIGPDARLRAVADDGRADHGHDRDSPRTTATKPSANHDTHGAHDKHAGHDPEMFRRRFWLSLLLTIPIVVSSEMVMGWFGYRLSGVAWVGP